ncbi:MAG TPA: hypothetical protein VLC97_10885 [Rhodanobacteraceae bacterium]|nr:hypothetical protein [Rhodanobacteraceae bacterium]
MQSNFRFCALVLAISLSGCAQRMMPPPPPPNPNPQVSLEIRQSPTVVPGFLSTYGSNGQMYVYRFTGGKHGNLQFKNGNGAANIHITLINSPNFAIKDVPIDGDPNHQLTAMVESNNKAHIQNKNTEELDAYYSVKVSDSNVADIYCDPGIINNR